MYARTHYFPQIRVTGITRMSAHQALAVDQGVARVLLQFGYCGGGAEELAEAVVFQGADAHVQLGRC